MQPADSTAPGEVWVEAGNKSVIVPEGEFRFEVKTARPVSFPGDLNIAFFDHDLLDFPLKLRRWRDGDSCQPLGMQGQHQKLQDFFSNQKLSRFAKEQVWILETDGKICWVAGMRPDERFKIRPSTKRYLEATFIPANFAE